MTNTQCAALVLALAAIAASVDGATWPAVMMVVGAMAFAMLGNEK